MLWWKDRARSARVVRRSAETRRATDDTSKLIAEALVQLHRTIGNVEQALKEIASEQPAE